MSSIAPADFAAADISDVIASPTCCAPLILNEIFVFMGYTIPNGKERCRR